jgi:fido (protein-threonine AMPylation protein)
LRKIAPKVYTSNFADDDEQIVKRNLYPILGRLFSGALLSHRSALEGRPTDSGDIFLSYTYTRQVALPGVRVHLTKGPGAAATDLPFLNGLFIASRPRAFLENLQVARTRSGLAKTLPKAEIEDRLDRICQAQGAEALNALRDAARELSGPLRMEAAFSRLEATIGAILRTRPAGSLSSPAARARSMGVPYDPSRLDLFNRLFSAVTQADLPVRRERRTSVGEQQLLAFFEAYFSNYIEGTEFEIAEAYDIVFRNKVPRNRPADAHDILGTFRVAVGLDKARAVPESFDDFLGALKSMHHDIMEARSDRAPGEFKEQTNRAGETVFVEPSLVRGTLLKGFEMAAAVAPGLPRAIFMMFLVAEVHPFTDGNGRVARLMMNAELARAELSRIILPTVFRDDYLLALRALSRSGNAAPLLGAMDHIQDFTARLPMSSYEAAVRALTDSNAFKDPDEARLSMPAPSSTGAGGGFTVPSRRQ